ncbi:MAG: hypothetical protein KDM63_12035 [Verrucomicrobiae bacterium]|nr:hypothetical protein [Verrucomicrobiae bacterium]
MIESDQGALEGLEGPESDMLKVISFGAFVSNNAKILRGGDLRTDAKQCLVFSLNRASRTESIHVELEKPIEIEEVILKQGEEMLSKREYLSILTPPMDRIPIPEITLNRLKNLIGGQAVSVSVTPSGAKSTAKVADFPFKIGFYPRDVVDLYLDMGSTNTKYLEATFPDKFEGWGDDCSEKTSMDLLLRHLAGKDNETSVDIPETISTKDFCDQKELREFDKAKLLSIDEAGVCEWFELALRDLVSYYAKRGSALHCVTWSYPGDTATCNRVTEVVNSRVSGYLLGKLRIIPEHLSLRHRFNHVLQVVSKVAKSKKAHRTEKLREKAEAHRKQEDYKNNFEVAPENGANIEMKD